MRKGSDGVERLKTDPHTVGMRTTLRAIETGKAELVFVAQDADVFVTRRVQEACRDANVAYERVSSMKDLGDACGVSVKTACAAIVKQ